MYGHEDRIVRRNPHFALAQGRESPVSGMGDLRLLVGVPTISLLFGSPPAAAAALEACGPHPEMLLSAAPERWPSGRRRTPGKCVDGEPSRGFESLSLRQPRLGLVGSPAGRAPGAEGAIPRRAAPGSRPRLRRRSVSVRPRSSSASVTPGRSGARGVGRRRARAGRTSAPRSASSASGDARVGLGDGGGDARAAAGPHHLDELQPQPLGQRRRKAQRRRRARGRARGRRGCASAWAGSRWRRARGAPPSRWGRRRARWRGRRRGRARIG